MALDIIAFDTKKAEAAGRKIRSESDKIKRLADKLKRAVDGAPSWWSGDSHNGFARQAGELVSLMYKGVDLVTDLGEDMLAVARTKKEDESRLKGELLRSLSVAFDGGYTGAVQGAASGVGGFLPGTAQYNSTGEWPDKGELTLKGGHGSGYGQEDDPLLSVGYKQTESIAYAGAEAYGKSEFAEGSAGIYAGYAEGYWGAGAGIFSMDEEGNKYFDPRIYAEVGGSVSAIYGKAEGRVGNEWIGAYGEVEGSVGTVSAEAGISIGMVDGKFDANASAGAEALLVEVEGRAGATIAGVDVGVTGSLKVGVGANAEVGLEDGVLKCEIGASLGVGFSVGFEVDVGAAVDAVVDAAEAVWDWISWW